MYFLYDPGKIRLKGNTWEKFNGLINILLIYLIII